MANHRIFSKHLRDYFEDHKLTDIDERAVVGYRNHRHRQPLRWNPKRTVKGATVNRELACLHSIFQFALRRKYIGENPTSGVKHFNERIERPSKRMLTVDDEHRILEAAPPHLRVAIVLLVQTGGRTYSEGLSLRWDQVDLGHGVIHPGSNVKTSDSAQPLPLSQLARDVLKEWKKEQGSESPFVFPSLRAPSKPIGSVKRAWRTALKRAGVAYFPIYNLRHVFCTRLSWVAPDVWFSEPCGTAVRKRSVTINSEWLTKSGKTSSELTNEPIVAKKKYYVFTTVRPRQKKKLPRLRSN